MELEQIFSLCGALSMTGWAGLVLLPRWHITRDWLAPVIAPVLIGICYLWLFTTNYPLIPADGGFGSLAAVASLFTVPELLLAGWIHYLAFDLFVGAWEIKDGQAHGIPHLLIIPCLFLTLMVGPVGLVAYWIVKLTVLAIKKQRGPSAAAHEG